MFCKYSNIFGEVNKGIHSYRFFNIAIVDVIMTLLIGYIIYYFYGKKNNISYGWILFYLFLLGIILHRLFCVRTTIDKILF